MLILAVLLSCALQDSDRLYIDEVREEFLRHWAVADESGRPKELFDLYLKIWDGPRQILAQPDPATLRWIPATRVLSSKLSALPPAALEPHELIAKQVFDTVSEPGERKRAIERYAYTRAGRDALDRKSNADADAGRLTEALRGWSRAMEERPTTELAARIALVHALRRDAAALSALRAHAEARGLKGPVQVGGRPRELLELIDSLMPPLPAPAPLLTPAGVPSCEVPLGRYEFKGEGRYIDRYAASLADSLRIEGRERIFFTNGFRVLALDPAKAEGGSVDDAIEWRYPQNNVDRSWTLGAGPNSTSLPYVGVAASEKRIVCTMFTTVSQVFQQVGRKQERFEGPASLRALDPATGELIWSTETAMTGEGAERGKLMDKLPFGRRDFCFGGPPLLRGDRVYAAVMTSPQTERQCWALCLDARDGSLLWCTNIASTPASTRTTPIVSFAEDEGTLVLATNFGVVAALDSEDGDFEWLIKYATDSTPRYTSSPPIIAGSLVYVFTQDYDKLMCFDRWSGVAVAQPKESAELPWLELWHLIGRAGDWLVFSGPKNVALRPVDGLVVNLPDSNSDRKGRGAIAGGRLYLPTRQDLSLFDVSTWKLIERIPWPEACSAGNLLISDTWCLLLSDRLDLYTSAAQLQARFAPLVDVPAPRPQDCRHYARILEAGGRLKDCVPYYRRAQQLWSKDPAWQETAETIRKKLEDLAEKLGADFPQE